VRITASPGAAKILMNLRITGETVEVSVWDSDPVLPVARVADAGRSTGTTLLAAGWGETPDWRPRPGAHGSVYGPCERW
jgi:hypothetical protein